jgi:N-acyl-phosphatidylethanolamine-hydrolysing phospholipase D
MSGRNSLKRFCNPHAAIRHNHFKQVLLWKFGWYNDFGERCAIPKDFIFPCPQETFKREAASVQWINHDTFLISYRGVHILTDPVWSQRCSPIAFIGPKRVHKPPVAIQDLPRIDFVVLSHDHYDHLDRYTVLQLVRKFPDIEWIVPKGVKAWFQRRGIHRVVELAWWESYHSISAGSIRFTAVPAQHFSGRSIFNQNKTLWMGVVVEFDSDKKLYFAGDTGYNSKDFKKIGETWGGFDLSLIPIGAYMPRKFLRPIHADPADAVTIHQDVRSKLSIGMHWQTFSLGDELDLQAPYELFKALQEQQINPNQFRVLEPGHAINW